MTVVSSEQAGQAAALPTSDSLSESGALRDRVLRGGIYLAARQSAGVFIGLVGAVLLTRLIGPANFGVYVALVMLFTYLQNFATLGVDAFLVRTEGSLEKHKLDEAFTLLLALSASVLLIAEAVLPAIAEFANLQRLGGAGHLALLALPFVVVAQVPTAKLEHDLEYRKVALIEAAAQILLYAVALPLAMLGWGARAALLGWAAQQALLFFSMFAAARYRPKFRLSRQMRSMLLYGVGFSSSVWVWQLRNLVSPLVVGRYGGPVAVGVIGLAVRLTENLAFVKRATWRLSMAALGRVQSQPAKLVAAIEQGMSLQLLALGPVLVAFAICADQILPFVFGAEWLAVLEVFPYIATGYLANATFNLHSSALYVVRRNWAVTRFHLAYITVFTMAALLCVPRWGVSGYGVAELLALPTYLLVDRGVAQAFGQRPRYSVAVVWALGFSLALFIGEAGAATLLGIVLIVIWPGTWREVRTFIGSFRRQKCPVLS